jgi:DNA modification methylase
MEIVKGRYGECRFCDNMDPEFGLPSLEEKSWDLCLTDPPYGINFKGKKSNVWNMNAYRDLKIYYEDNMSSKDYLEWCWIWRDLCIKKANGLIVTCGRVNLFEWILNKVPDYQLSFWYKDFSADFHHYDPILRYGKIPNPSTFRDVWNIPLLKPTEYFKHPCPKSIELWEMIIKSQNPTSVLDPFLGSGTTAEVCESLKIPWLGYEIMEAYKPDIEKRIKRGIEKSKQTNLEAFFT